MYILEGYNSGIIEGQNANPTPKTGSPSPTPKTGSPSPTPKTGSPSPIPGTPPVQLSLKESLDKIQPTLKENFSNTLATLIQDMNSSGKLYDSSKGAYITKLKNMEFIELGNPNNSEALEFIQHVIINFLKLSDQEVSDMFQQLGYCDKDLNVDIFLGLAVLYQKNTGGNYDNVVQSKMVFVENILSKLSRYVPDIFQKILNGLKLCDKSGHKYLILDSIYKSTFKYNQTTVNFGIMDNITQIFSYLKGMKTVEMIVIIIAMAFVISKVLDMFRVKVEV